MELKNIFKMTKIDRYTQDGRDQIAKLQETEDVRYKTGDISQKTGLQKQPDGSWAPPKKGGKPAAKKEAGSINRTPERIAKETAIMEALNLSTGEDNNLHKMSDETIERLYAKTQEKPAEGWTETRMASGKLYDLKSQGKRIIEQYDPETETKTFKLRDLNNFRSPDKEFKTLEEAKAAAESKPATSKPDTKEQTKALMEKYKDLPGAQKKDALYAATFEGSPIGMTQNQMERQGWDLVQADDDVNVYAKPDGSKVTMKHDGKTITSSEYEAPGSKLESDFDDEGDSTGTNYQEKVEQNPRDGYNFEKMIQHRIPTSQTDKEELRGIRSFMNEEKATYQNALKSRAQALVDGHKSNGDWYPEKEQAIMKIAKAVGFDEELHKFIEEENRGYDLGYSEDEAPKIRELTGDCKIKIRQTQDVKYNTGDISQKTGLQKQPDGSWAPPKTGKTPGSKSEEQTATEAAKASQEKPARKSLNQIMLEKKGFKRVENSTGPRANMPRYQYTSRIGKTYNVWRGPAGIDGFVYYVQTPGGFAKKMKDVDEIKRYLESDGGNWGNAPGPRGLFHSPGESRPAAFKETNPDDWAWAEGVASRNNIHPMDLIKNNKALKPGVNVKFSTPKDGELEGEIVDIAGYEGKAYVQVSTKKGNRMIPTEKLSVDSAPRILTGDTKIRIKK